MADLKKILCVDDNEGIHELLRRSLTEFELEFCSSGREMLQTVQRFDPDLILIDMMMPDLSGEESIMELHRMGVLHIPFIFFTAMDENGLDISAHKGCIGFIAKPFGIRALPEQIKELFAKIKD